MIFKTIPEVEKLINRIDLNADAGESFGAYKMGNDEGLYPFISSVNIACGFHGGDFSVMRRSVSLAKSHGVAVGAHPSYPDSQGFGRRDMSLTTDEIYDSLVYQIGALQAFCQIEGVELEHVKPHGALYNRATQDREVADAIASAVKDVLPNALLYGLYGGQLIAAGQAAGIPVVREAFADRGYMANGTLMPRNQHCSVLHDSSVVMNQVKRLVLEGHVMTVLGERVDIEADTICFHGDGAGVVELLRAVRNVLAREGVAVQKIGSSL